MMSDFECEVSETMLRQAAFLNNKFEQQQTAEAKADKEALLKSWHIVHSSEEEISSLEIKEFIARNMIEVNSQLNQLDVMLGELREQLMEVASNLETVTATRTTLHETVLVQEEGAGGTPTDTETSSKRFNADLEQLIEGFEALSSELERMGTSVPQFTKDKSGSEITRFIFDEASRLRNERLDLEARLEKVRGHIAQEAMAREEQPVNTTTSPPRALSLPPPPPPLEKDESVHDSTNITELAELGVIIVNSDGTMSRIPNWHQLTDRERASTARLISARNKARMAKLQSAND